MVLPREEKLAWAGLPGGLRAQLEETLGSRVQRARRVWGGYGPSVTLRLRLADGRRVFLKGAFPHPTSNMLWAIQREQRVYRELGTWLSPWVPDFLGSVQYAEWQTLLLEDLGPKSVPPWTARQARAALHGYASFHAATLGQPLPAWLSRKGHKSFAQYWAQPGALDPDALAALAGPRQSEAAAWLARHLPALDAAARGIEGLGEPFALLHLDTRSDNLRLQRGQLRLFDWPYACVGPAELDAVGFIQSIVAEGGPPAEQLLAWYQERLPLRADALTVCLAGLAGYFAANAPRPELEGLPRLRWVQRKQLRACLPWAAARLGLPEPAWAAAIPTEPPSV